jgi:phenylpyruvate tautomerase PptA (4-oxalocrotonate tautomerase family)
MPLYRCMVAEGLTSLEQRSLIAKEITRIHCEITGAPPAFVHAFFAEDPDAQLPDGKKAVVLGSIRAGRSDGQKQQLVSRMRRAISTVVGTAEAEVTVQTVDVPARWIMEGGEILPEPGEEDAWLASHGSSQT